MFINKPVTSKIKALFFLLVLSILSACGTTNRNIIVEHDPLEKVNRAIYVFNDGFDRAIGRPVANWYQDHFPDPIQIAVHNFFENLDDFIVLSNDFFQLKGKQGLKDSGRFLVNSTVGILGLMDVATDLGLPKHNEDLNQTLGYWGIPDGPYLVLPFFGSYNLRGVFAFTVESPVLDPIYQVSDRKIRAELITGDFFDTRVQLLLASEMLDEAALDPYDYVRESFRQRQRSLIYDGNPPTNMVDELDMLDEL